MKYAIIELEDDYCDYTHDWMHQNPKAMPIKQVWYTFDAMEIAENGFSDETVENPDLRELRLFNANWGPRRSFRVSVNYGEHGGDGFIEVFTGTYPEAYRFVSTCFENAKITGVTDEDGQSFTIWLERPYADDPSQMQEISVEFREEGVAPVED